MPKSIYRSYTVYRAIRPVDAAEETRAPYAYRTEEEDRAEVHIEHKKKSEQTCRSAYRAEDSQNYFIATLQVRIQNEC